MTVLEDAAEAPRTPESAPRWSNRVGFVGAHVFVFAYLGVLGGGFYMQFGLNEFPCPLCILQRMAMVLAVFGPVYIVARAKWGEVSLRDYAFGYGTSIVSAVVGAAMSARQILLHIVPPDPGFGSAVFGLHLYTWALITFVVVLAYCGVMLIFGEQTRPRGVSYGWPSKLLLWLFFLVVVANAVAVFAEEGFHWVLPDDPTSYRLFD